MIIFWLRYESFFLFGINFKINAQINAQNSDHDVAIDRPSTSRAIADDFNTPPNVGSPLPMLEQANDAPSITHLLAEEVYFSRFSLERIKDSPEGN